MRIMRMLLNRIGRLARVVLLLGAAEATFAQTGTTAEPAAVELNTARTLFPADLSPLNHRPAGAPGRVFARGEALYFGDGRPARFWGVNIQANALFGTTDGDIAAHAARLARMGVNLVRLHHHDSAWVQPNIFGRDAQSTAELDPDALARIDAWVAALKAEGIYIWLDLHVGRRLAPADQIALGEELRASRHAGDLRGYNFVNDDIAAMMARTASQYLTHTNPATGLSYAEDPAIAVVQISNENDLLKHFANRLLPGKGAPGHAALFSQAAEAFARQHGMRAGATGRGLGRGLFLSDLEHRFFAQMTRGIREAGYTGLIAPSNFWGGMPLAGLSALSAGDLIDVHSYAKPGEMRAPPADTSTMLARIAGAQVAGQPLSVSEWNMAGFPAPDRHMAPPRIAAMAAFQGWDALMLYGYAQRALSRPSRPGKWHAATDPALMATLPVGALLYRGGHIAPARTLYYFAPDPRTLYGQALSADTMPALRDIPERAGLRVALPRVAQLPWMRPSPLPAVTDGVFADPRARPLPPGKAGAPVVSDTGEMRRDPATGVQVIDTARSQIVMGPLAQHPAILAGLEVEIATETGLVAVQSLGPAPLAEATGVLVSLALPAAPTNTGPGTNTGTNIGARAALPFLAPPAHGVIRFDAAPDLRLLEVVPAAARARIAHKVTDGRHELLLTGAPGALWITFGR